MKLAPEHRVVVAILCGLVGYVCLTWREPVDGDGAKPNAAQKRGNTIFSRLRLNAKCLDGSAAGGYYAKGDPNLVVIWMEGGGYCDTKKGCALRARGPSVDQMHGRGGSKRWPERCLAQYCESSQSVLSSDCAVNPVFCTATRVFLKYCSGDRWLGTSGYNKEYDVHFSGHAIVMETLQWLQSESLPASGGRLLLGGRSVGGVGALYHADAAADSYRPKNVEVRALVGWGVDVVLDKEDADPPFARLRTVRGNMTVGWGESGGPRDQRCSRDCQESQAPYRPSACDGLPAHECVAIQVALRMRTSAFYAQSPSSALALGRLPVNSDTCGYLLRYAEAAAVTLREIAAAGAKKGDALWLPWCWLHGVPFTKTQVSGRTMSATLGEWWAEKGQKSARVYADSACADVQCNPTCPRHTALAAGGCLRRKDRI